MTSRACRNALLEDALRREVTGKGAAATLDALDLESSAVAMQRVLDDGQAEP